MSTKLLSSHENLNVATDVGLASYVRIFNGHASSTALITNSNSNTISISSQDVVVINKLPTETLVSSITDGTTTASSVAVT